MRETNLAPGLLVATPRLSNTIFPRAVVLMVEHNSQGSCGVVINHPSQLLVTELLPRIKIEWQGDPKAKIWAGGPVMPDSGWVLHTGCKNLPLPTSSLNVALQTTGSIQVCDGLVLSTNQSNMRILAAAPPKHARIIMGYSGWAAGQLAAEMAQGAWLHADIDRTALFHSPPEDLWEHCLKTMGIPPHSIGQSWRVH